MNITLAIIALVNCFLTIFCVVANQLNRTKLLMIYLTCEIVGIFLNTTLAITFVCITISNGLYSSSYSEIFIVFWFDVGLITSFFVVFIGCQVYICIMVSTKLSNMVNKALYENPDIIDHGQDEKIIGNKDISDMNAPYNSVGFPYNVTFGDTTIPNSVTADANVKCNKNETNNVLVEIDDVTNI